MKVITIGRGQDNDIEVNDVNASRNHVQIVQSDSGSYSVVDLGSTNGTYVNGQRITGETPLQAQDIIKIGNTVLPWQSYFMAAAEPKVQTIIEPEPKPEKPKRTIWYIAAAAALLVFVGGGAFWLINRDNDTSSEYYYNNIPNEGTIARFDELTERAERISRMGGEIDIFLIEMQEIADRYPDFDNFRFKRIIQELKNN